MINFQNFCKFQGRLTKNPELTKTKNGKDQCKFTLGVDCGTDESWNKKSAFPQFTAYGKQAEFISKYFEKGKPIEIISEFRTWTTGEGENRSYWSEFRVCLASFIPFVPKESNQTTTTQNKDPDKNWKEDYSKDAAAQKRQEAADFDPPPIEQLEQVQESQFDFGDTDHNDVPF